MRVFKGEFRAILFEAGAMALFQCGAIRLIHGTPEWLVSGESTILYFRVADIHGVHSALKDCGVPIVQEPHVAARMRCRDLWQSFLRDPDGNTLARMSKIGRTQPAEMGQ